METDVVAAPMIHHTLVDMNSCCVASLAYFYD